MRSERPLDPPEAPGCEYCNPDSLAGEDFYYAIQICCHPHPHGGHLLCTRPVGHDEEHACCARNGHPLITWIAYIY